MFALAKSHCHEPLSTLKPFLVNMRTVIGHVSAEDRQLVCISQRLIPIYFFLSVLRMFGFNRLIEQAEYSAIPGERLQGIDV